LLVFRPNSLNQSREERHATLYECGAAIADSAGFCPSCGATQGAAASSLPPPPRNPV